MQRIFWLAFSLLIFTRALSQDEMNVHIHHPIVPWRVSDSIVIEVWKFYLCDFSCDGLMTNECMLIEKDTLITLKCIDDLQHSLMFRLGVDSLKQSRPNYSGALNPLNNMYWTWHSGYIQLKAEGSVLNNSGIWENFQWHLGGFRQYRTDRLINHMIEGNHVDFKWDEDKISHLLHLNPQLNIMSECQEAADIMEQITNSIIIE